MNSSTTARLVKIFRAAEGGHAPYDGYLIGAKPLNPFDKVGQQHYFHKQNIPRHLGMLISSEKLHGLPTFVLVNSHD